MQKHAIRILLLSLLTIALNACIVVPFDAGRSLVISPLLLFQPDPARRLSIYDCEDRPLEAYIKGTKCTGPSPISRWTANDRVSGDLCALESSIRYNQPDVFDELVSNGANPKRCGNYPASLYLYIAEACREHPDFANRYFAFLEKSGTLKEYPQILLHYAALTRCVEGVQLAMRFGALADAPVKPRWDGGLPHPVSPLVPLEASLYKSLLRNRSPGGDQRRLQIVRLLVNAGGNPWALDSSGKTTIYDAAEKSLSNLPTWPSVKAILLSSPLKPAQE